MTQAMNWQRYTLTADTPPSITQTQTPPPPAPDGLAPVSRVTLGWAGSKSSNGVVGGQRTGRDRECLPYLTSAGLWGGL